MIAGALLRAWVLPLPGTGDVDVWKIWSFGAAHDLTGVYGVGGSPPERRLLHWQGAETTVNYPPVALAELGATGWLYEARHPLFENSPTLNGVVKLPGIAAELLLVVLALTWGRTHLGAAAATSIALGLWLNPAIVLTGPILGYLDAQVALPAVIALTAAWMGAGWLAGLTIAIAVLTKPQAIFVAPVIAGVLLSRRRGWRLAMHAAATALATSAVVLLPYVARGAWANFMQAMGRLGTHDMLSGNAANVWWIFTWVLRVLDVAGEWGWKGALTQEVRILGISRAIALGYPNARVVGAILVLAASAWAAWRARRAATLASASALAGWSVLAYAMLAAQVHENHLFLAVPFFVVAAALDRRYRAMSWWVTTIFALNLLLFEGLGRGVPRPFDRRWTGIDATVILAFVSVGVFVWMTAAIATNIGFTQRAQRSRRPDGRHTPPAVADDRTEVGNKSRP